MRIIEIILPKNTDDRSFSFQTMQKIGMLQKRMNTYVDKIVNANTSPAGREFLKSKLKSDYHKLRSLIPHSREIAEAVHKLPLTPKDFELIKKLMEKPIPAVIAPIYISEVIDDDELNDQFKSLEETDPGRDIRPLIVEWIRRVMPDQMHQFTGEVANHKQKMGILSPLHGYDPHMYKGAGMTGTESSGNAYGRA
jgi:hypothetical protein